MNDWAEHYNVYIEAKVLFRKGINTTDNIHFILHGSILVASIFPAFVDFRKNLTILCVNFCSLNLWR